MKETGVLHAVLSWIDTSRGSTETNTGADIEQIDWLRIIPFIGLHLACIGVLWVGWSPVAVAVAVFMYGIRMFAITSFYHRYFSHKAFKTSRAAQFIFAVLGASATQRGPLWWAAHHRHHHIHSDDALDVHSPKKGFLWSHIGWFLCRRHFATRIERVPDLSRYRELVILDKYDTLIPVVTGFVMFAIGWLLEAVAPQLGTNGWQMLVWGYFISTVALIHVTLSINSLAHKLGSRRYPTHDDSRNNFLLALFTLGEGWHNNHHYCPGSARQGFFWWEVDISFYLLKGMEKLGLVWDLKPVPEKAKRIPKAGASQ